MTLFFTTLAKRRAAMLVLVAWVFMLVSGITNACLLERGTAQHGWSGAGHSANPPMPVAHDLHRGDAHGDDTTATASRKSCLKACDDGSKSLLKAPAGIDLADPGPALQFASGWDAAASAALPSGQVLDPVPPDMGPPIRVRFARLAL